MWWGEHQITNRQRHIDGKICDAHPCEFRSPKLSPSSLSPLLTYVRKIRAGVRTQISERAADSRVPRLNDFPTQ